MSKFENLSDMIANHETFWSVLGSKLTTGQPLGKALAHFYKVVWDPWYSAWLAHQSSCEQGSCDDDEIDRLTDVAAKGLSRIRASAKGSYGLPIPDLGSAGPSTYAGAVSLIGAFGDAGYANAWANQQRAQANAPRNTNARKPVAGRQGGVTDHRSNPGGYDPRAMSRSSPNMGRNAGVSDIVKQLQAQEAQGAPDDAQAAYNDASDPFADQGDDQGDVSSGWLSDAWDSTTKFVKGHVSDIKSAAQYAAGAIGGKLGEKLAGAAVDAALGDPSAAKAIAAAAAHADPNVQHAAAIASDAASKAIIAQKMTSAVNDAAKGNTQAKIALAKVSIAAQDPNAHPDVQFAASIAESAASSVRQSRSNPLSLMASWG